jgi:hypothetical protein
MVHSLKMVNGRFIKEFLSIKRVEKNSEAQEGHSCGQEENYPPRCYYGEGGEKESPRFLDGVSSVEEEEKRD